MRYSKQFKPIQNVEVTVIATNIKWSRMRTFSRKRGTLWAIWVSLLSLFAARLRSRVERKSGKAKIIKSTYPERKLEVETSWWCRNVKQVLYRANHRVECQDSEIPQGHQNRITSNVCIVTNSQNRGLEIWQSFFEHQCLWH